MSKILTAGINLHPLLKLPVKAIAENIAQQKFCDKMHCIEIIYAVYRPLQKIYNWKPFTNNRCYIF